jgi:hypothetical protein
VVVVVVVVCTRRSAAVRCRCDAGRDDIICVVEERRLEDGTLRLRFG